MSQKAESQLNRDLFPYYTVLSKGCLNVLGISAWHHAVGLFLVESLLYRLFELGQSGLLARWEFFLELSQRRSQKVQCGQRVA